MSKAYEEIKTGLEEAIDFAAGKKSAARVHRFNSVDVRNLRKKLHMTQEVFASSFGISLGTLRHWERGDRHPQGPALVLLNLVEKSPKLALNALAR